MTVRSRVHMLNVAAARLEQCSANQKLIADLREAAKQAASRRAEGRDWSEEEERRAARQRNLFTYLPPSHEKTALKEAIMQRAYDLLWDGDCSGCDALLEFIPSDAAETILNAYSKDCEVREDRSPWYDGHRRVV